MAKLTKLAEQKFGAFMTSLGIGYGVDNVTNSFSVSPEKVDSITTGWKQNTSFLDKVSVLPVDAQSGNVIRLSANKISRKVNVDGDEERKGVSVAGTSKRTYLCNPLPQDVKIPFSLVNSWAHLDKFNEELMKYINSARSADLITIGWNGTSDADSSDIDANTMLEDCGIGWPELLKVAVPANYISEIVASSGAIVVNGTAAEGKYDYKTFDALVTDMLHRIPKNKRTGNEVVILGDDILSLRDQVLYAGVEKPGDTASPIANRCGGLPIGEQPHDFPDDAIFVGDPKNLHIYVLVDSMTKAVTVEHAKSAVVDWLNTEVDWEIGDPEAMVFVPTGVITTTARV